MSYYCKGETCPRANECLRVEEWRRFPKKDVIPGMASCVWFVPEFVCIRNNYEDGVFLKQ